MRNDRGNDLDDYNYQQPQAAFSKGIARNAGGNVVNGQRKKRNVFTSSNKVADVVQITVVGASVLRNYLLIQNTGAGVIYLGFGVVPDATGTNAIKLPAGTQIDFSDGVVPQNDVYAIAPAQTPFTVLEGNEQY